MSSDAPTGGAPSLAPVITLVVWVVCLGTGVLGLVLPYPPVRLFMEWRELPPTQLVEAQLPPAMPTPAPSPITALPPPAPGPSAEPPPALAPAPLAAAQNDLPALTAVAPPGPAISFAMPVTGLTRVVDAVHAGASRQVPSGPSSTGRGSGGGIAPPPPPAPAATAPVVARLTLGEGEGRQPPPAYPREAILARQQGTVQLRFTVDETGTVQSVEIIVPSRWPLLNQAATRAIRDTWHFNPGPRRVYEVPIEFQLNP